MFICRNCGEIFEQPSEEQIYQGEFWGAPAYEGWAVCPCCRNDEMEEADCCSVCGEWHEIEELTSGICKKCIDGYRKNFPACYGLAFMVGYNEAVDINGAIVAILGEENINSILWRYITEKMPNVDCSPFIDADTDWLAEKIKKYEEVKM